MNKSNLLFAAVGILAGFIIGFVFANSTNREYAQTGTKGARADAPKATANSATKDSAATLPDDELRQAIATTDARPEDTDLQKRFGLALYRYANQKRDPRFLPDAARFLKRAFDADPRDLTVTVSLANALFDMGQLSDPARFAEARTYYEKALELKPDDVNVRTDLGLTYYYGTPSDPVSAIREYRKSLQLDARHEPTLQNMATALIKTGNRAEAQKMIETLRNVNPQNPALSDLEALIAQSEIKSQQ